TLHASRPGPRRRRQRPRARHRPGDRRSPRRVSGGVEQRDPRGRLGLRAARPLVRSSSDLCRHPLPMTTLEHVRVRRSGRQMLNKVPEVPLYFWIIKVLCTTVGETASDFLSDNVGLGLTKTTFITGALLLVALAFQFRATRYIAEIYWLAV